MLQTVFSLHPSLSNALFPFLLIPLSPSTTLGLLPRNSISLRWRSLSSRMSSTLLLPTKALVFKLLFTSLSRRFWLHALPSRTLLCSYPTSTTCKCFHIIKFKSVGADICNRPVNLSAFGLDNKLGYEGGAEVFYPAADPSGYITATVTRK